MTSTTSTSSNSNNSNSDDDQAGAAASPPLLPPSIAHNLPLIHRCLLADPSEYESLTWSGRPRQWSTPSYEEFVADLQEASNLHDDNNNPETIALAMKRAFLDQVCQRIQSPSPSSQRDPSSSSALLNLQPAQDLLLELHQQLRALIPSRTDLHGLLRDEPVQRDATTTKDEPRSSCSSMAQLWALTIQAARATSLLESEARAASTRAWIAVAQPRQEELAASTTDSDSSLTIFFLVSSLLYLLYKAELCANDKQEFYFSTLWLPLLVRQQQGAALERAALAQRQQQQQGNGISGSGGSVVESLTLEALPATRAWLQEAYENRDTTNDNRRNDDTSTEDQHHHYHRLLRTSWVRDILFRSPHNNNTATTASLVWPEIFYLDQAFFQGLRLRIRLAVAGSALALYASRVAHNPQALTTTTTSNADNNNNNGHDDDNNNDNDELELRRAALVNAMGARGQASETVYRHDIIDATVQLARYWKRSTTATNTPLDEDALRQHCRGVILGQDPVLQLLEQRMKTCFEELIQHGNGEGTTTTTTTTNPVVAPARLQSDRAAPTLSSSQPPKQQPQRPHRKRDFLQRANALFGRRGLSFFGSDLALCSWNALRVIETALDIYGAALLEPELSRLAAESTSS